MPTTFDPNSVPVYEGSAGVGTSSFNRNTFLQVKLSPGPNPSLFPNWLEGGSYFIQQLQQLGD